MVALTLAPSHILTTPLKALVSTCNGYVRALEALLGRRWGTKAVERRIPLERRGGYEALL